MYTPGKLIYFDPFHFKNGSGSTPKFFLVLKIINQSVILATLPSSKVHLPPNQPTNHGCLEVPEAGINCYIFQAGKPVTKAGWSFPRNTFLYGMWLDDYNVEILNKKYQIENVDFEIIGELTDEELNNVINCFIHSATVKRKYKRLLAL